MSSEAGAVDGLHVDHDLLAVVADDQDTDAATTRPEGILEAVPEVALVNDGKIPLDIARLGYGDNGGILHVQDAVLLENRAAHGLDHDAGGGVRDVRRLLMQLLGEEINTKVAVLASRSRRRDADHLARPALEDEDVAQVDVVARNRHRVRHVRFLAIVVVGVAHVGVVAANKVARSVNCLFDDVYLLVEGGVFVSGAGNLD